LEAGRLEVIAGCRYAGEPDHHPFPRQLHRQATGAQELDLGTLHVAEEIREVHDAGHVGLVKLHAVRRAERRHERYFLMTASVASAIARAWNRSKTACLPVPASFSRSAGSSRRRVKASARSTGS